MTFFDAIQNQINMPLEPLEKYLQANFKYALFDRKYCTRDARKIHIYKLRAIQKQWCETYQKLLEVLYKFGKKYTLEEQARENDEGALEKEWPPLFGDFLEPQIHAMRIIEKLDYTGWQKKANFIEWCFLQPLENSFKVLRKNMFVLYMQGKSKTPFTPNRQISGDSHLTRT